MARKSKDPRKPSQAFLRATGQAASNDNTNEPKTDAAVDDALTSEADMLRRAIKELGGDDDDFELLKGLSDDEEEEEKPKAKKNQKPQVDETKLKQELSSFLKGLDFSASVPDVAEDEEVVEGEDEEENEEDEEENEEDEDEDEEEEEDSPEEEEDDEAAKSDESEEEVAKNVKPTAAAQTKAVRQSSPEIEGFVKKSGLSAVQPSKDSSIYNIPQEPLWYNIALPELPDYEQAEPLPPFRLAGIQSRVNSLLTDFRSSVAAGASNGQGKGKGASKNSATFGKSTADAAFLRQVLQDGTHQDKLSALILLVRESPLHRMDELERLRIMAGGKQYDTSDAGSSTYSGVKGGGGREERIAVLRALADWWVSGGGKEAGKLRYLADQPQLGNPAVTDRHLLVWGFEDWLKKWFFSILQILEVYLADTLPYVKTQAMAVTMKLLAGNAEQEQNLLRLGVNKLGDTDKAIASKASHHLLVLLQAHPAMKAVVVREVSTIVLRPIPKVDTKDIKGKGKAAEVHDTGLEHGRYYGLITLNQITLTSRDRDLAGQLVHVYFELFREILGSGHGKGSHDAEADSQAKLEKVTGKVDKWQGRRKGTKHSKKKNAQNEEEVEQGDSKLIAAVLTGVSRALPFARLDDENFQQHTEMLFKITHTGTFNISIRALMLIYQVSSAKQETSDRFYRTLYESLLDPRLLNSSKQAMYLNLLFKAMKADTNLDRVMAFVKRLVQVMMGHQPPFICGALYLLGELFSTTSGLSTLVTEPEDSGIEHFVDVPDEDTKEKRQNAAIEIDRKPEHEYDGRKRDPQHSNAKGSCLWELIPLTRHYHPSVAVQASELIALKLPLSGSADISQNTLVSFLDRFVYRNPKKNATAKGASIMQPAAAALNGRAGAAVVVRSKGAKVTGDAAGYVNDEKFWKKKVEEVPADQLFFHKYFSKKLARDEQIKAAAAKRKKKGVDEDDEDEDVSMDDADEEEGEQQDIVPTSKAKAEHAVAEDEEESDPEEDEIWKAMQSSMPQAGYDDNDLLEDSDEDEDLDMSEDEDEVDEDVDEDEDDGRIDDAEFEDEDEDELPVDEDEDDLIDLNDLPNIPLGSGDFGTYDSDDDEEEFTGVGNASKKRKRDAKSTDGKKKEKRKKLPLLASAEDYAALINDAEEENI